MGGSIYSDNSVASFTDALEQRITNSRKNARRNYFSAYICYGVAIATSLLATLAAATDFLPKANLAVLTAIPGTALLVNSVFSFENKSNWYWRKARRYDGILMSVRFEGLELSSASKDLRIYDEKMEAEYPKFGMIPQKRDIG